ncbi:AI-2E family transporter [Oleiagrimonas soli]|uniref:Membrane protein n=1 Tax=Oleiagrimonas soli TaxID=1543381 RepID=A0A099CUB2_9GAMM|nr:AI-2E family transporter [Oleiagrimonas soli]KGI77222.1 membrane protein [Oleiagrimonas soli]MBB6185594.1 putative PurR-regulated permease PerM [Oleiagrimonas soli]
MTPDIARRWQGLVLALVLFGVLWLLAPVLMPFAVAAGFAYLGDPIADRLERWKMSRTLAVSLVFACMLLIVAGALLLLVPLLQHQIRNLIENIPRYVEWVRGVAMPWLQAHLHLNAEAFDTQKLVDTLKQHIGSVSGIAAAVLGKVSRSGFGLIAWLANLVLIPVVTFYLLRDWDVLMARIERMLPRRQAPVIRRLARESDQVLGAFVRGQLLVMLALGVIYGTGLTLIGLSVGPLIGMVAGLLSFVPYLGFIIGLGASLIAALVQYGDWMHIALVLVVFGIGQVLEGYVLVPRLVGNKIGLHPVAVIFAVLAGGHLFGFLGVLLALPAAAVIMVLLRYGYERYRVSDLYGHEHDPPVLDEDGATQASSVPDVRESDD